MPLDREIDEIKWHSSFAGCFVLISLSLSLSWLWFQNVTSLRSTHTYDVRMYDCALSCILWEVPTSTLVASLPAQVAEHPNIVGVVVFFLTLERNSLCHCQMPASKPALITCSVANLMFSTKNLLLKNGQDYIKKSLLEYKYRKECRFCT